MRLKRLLAPALALSLLMLLPLASFGQVMRIGVPRSYSPLLHTLHMIENYYVDSVGVDSLINQTIVSLLEQLDPHSSYIPKEATDDVRVSLTGRFYGVGIQFQIYKDTLCVMGIVPNGPAQKVGMLPNDRIIGIDHKGVAGVRLTNMQVMRSLRGEKGTRVDLRVLRGIDTLDFTVFRDSIALNTVDAAYMVEPSVGLVSFNSFALTTHQEVRDAIESLRKQGMKSLILDMRGNAGGIMDAAVDIAGDFLPKNSLIVYSQGKGLPKQDRVTTKDGKYRDMKLVVLVDEFSASSSEIVAGALQDHDRAVLVGRRSFGKGLVQHQVELDNGAFLRLTVARYYTPSGRCIQTPYQLGHAKDYADLFAKRYLEGLRGATDTAHMPDSLLYTTLNAKRPVYGGGGIMPDVMVPIDTNERMPVFVGTIIRRGLLMQWATRYVSAHYKQGKDLPFERFDREFRFTPEMESNLLGYVRGELKRDTLPTIDSSVRDVLGYRVKAQLAQSLYGFAEMIRVLNSRSDECKRASAILREWDKQGAPLLAPARSRRRK